MALNLKKLVGKVARATKSPEGKAAIAVASVVLPIAAPKAVAKGVKLYRKAKVVREVVGR